MLKSRCCIYYNLLSFHNNFKTCASNHILCHNIATPQDIVAAITLASKCEPNGETFLVHKLPTPPLVKKEPLSDVALMQRTFAAHSYGTGTTPYIGSSKPSQSR